MQINIDLNIGALFRPIRSLLPILANRRASILYGLFIIWMVGNMTDRDTTVLLAFYLEFMTLWFVAEIADKKSKDKSDGPV